MLEAWHAFARTTCAQHTKCSTSCPFTTVQWLALSAIKNKEVSSVTEIKKILSISSSAATQLVNELVKKGSVTKCADPDDGRTTRLALSSSAHRDLARMHSIMLKRFTKRFSVLTDREFTTYMRLQLKLIKKSKK